jgi:hypothetical protein
MMMVGLSQRKRRFEEVGLIVDAPAAGGSSSKLICTNLPPECTEEIMGALFAQYVPLSITSMS